MRYLKFSLRITVDCEDIPITLLFLTSFYRRSKPRNRSARAPAGSPSTWSPRTTSGRLLGAVPCYLKSHSQGEYVFDHGWADAYERAGGSYYPKLQVCVPFTPATGPRLLARPGPQAASVRAALAAGLIALCEMREASSVHATFLPEDEWRLLAAQGFLQRTDQQFHFENDGYASFEDFLAALSSRKRKFIRRERREALPEGVTIHHLTGADLTEEIWDAFFALLHGDRIAQMGPALSDAKILFADRAKHAGARPADHGEARRPLDRGRDQFHRERNALWPPLGRDRASSLPAFRDLLLPGHRIRDRPRPQARRSRRAGRAQARARLCAGDDLFRPLHRRSRAAPRDRRLSQARAHACRGRRRRACRLRAFPQR